MQIHLLTILNNRPCRLVEKTKSRDHKAGMFEDLRKEIPPFYLETITPFDGVQPVCVLGPNMVLCNGKLVYTFPSPVEETYDRKYPGAISKAWISFLREGFKDTELLKRLLGTSEIVSVFYDEHDTTFPKALRFKTRVSDTVHVGTTFEVWFSVSGGTNARAKIMELTLMLDRSLAQAKNLNKRAMVLSDALPDLMQVLNLDRITILEDTPTKDHIIDICNH